MSWPMTTPRPHLVAAGDRPRLTTSEVADELRLSVRTVCGLIRTGRLPAVRIGRRWLVECSDVASYLAAQPGNGLARELLGRPA